MLNQPSVYPLKITKTDFAGWTKTLQIEVIVYILVSLEVLPKVFKGNKGIFTVKAILPEVLVGFTFYAFTVTSNGVAPVIDNNGLNMQAEKGHFKFEREDFEWNTGKQKLELHGYFDNGYIVKGFT